MARHYEHSVNTDTLLREYAWLFIRHRPWGDWRAKGSGMDSSSLACSGSGLDWLVALRGS